MTQQQQIALLQQMAQMQMAQMGNQQSQSPLNMMMPGGGQYVLVPQSQLAQIQQFQEAQLRQQMAQQQMLPNLESDFIKSNTPRSPIQRPQNTFEKISKNSNQGQKNQPKGLPKRVLVTKLPPHIKTVEALADVFYPYGIISEIQIFKNPSQISFEMSKIIEKVDPRPNAMPAATVEFETSQAAKFAVSIMRKREKQLQFRVALLKGDGVDEKHCHNYQKVRRPSITKSIVGSETDNFSSSGYDSCSMKSESPRPKAGSDSEFFNAIEDFENLSISGNSAISGNSETGKKNLGPIARPLNKKNKTNQKIGQLGRYRAKQAM